MLDYPIGHKNTVTACKLKLKMKKNLDRIFYLEIYHTQAWRKYIL